MSRLAWATLLACGVAWTNVALADTLSIYDIQVTTTNGDTSSYHLTTHNVLAGVVTHIQPGSTPRVYLQDPAHPTWGAIAVKDFHGGELANAVQVGDLVSFDAIYIEEYRGTTFLQYNRGLAPGVAFTVHSTGNPVPAPLVLNVADLVNPANHAVTEQYESMMVTLPNVTVGQLDLGKAGDNYELLGGSHTAWATDYYNLDAGGPYHPYVHTGVTFTSITGFVEQYTRNEWDYYQLCTRSTGDIVPEPASVLWLVVAGGLMRRRR